MICPNCGMETDGKFCPGCGTKLPAPEDAAPAGMDEAVRQAETAAAAAAAAIAAETVQPEPAVEEPAPSPAQGFSAGRPAPNPGYPNQPAPGQAPQAYNPYGGQPYNPYGGQAPNPGYAGPNPGYAAPNPGYAASNPGYAGPNPGYAGQGYNPNQGQGYNPNQGQGYNPNQGQGYNPYPNRATGYVPAQGYNPGARDTGGYRVPTPAEIGRSPASQLLRRLGRSGAFLTAVILTTVTFLFSLLSGIASIAQIVRILRYIGSDYEITFYSSLAGVVIGLISSALSLLLLWLIVGAAANRRSPLMGTGALTTFKVFHIIGLVGLCIGLAFTVIFGLVAALSDNGGELSYELAGYLNGLLRQYGVHFSLPQFNDLLFVCVLFGGLILALIFGILYSAKVLKTINTAKRVVRTGRPDDRVSPFLAVLILLGAAFRIFGAVSRLLGGASVADLLSCVSGLTSAAAAICFAVVIFKFRSGMRRLGVYRGVPTRPEQ